jgi:ACR3 family arsenite transporter
MFSLKGELIIQIPLDVLLHCALLSVFFAPNVYFKFFTGKYFGADYNKAAIAFTATGNNFELAIAVAIGVFGIDSKPSLSNRPLVGSTGDCLGECCLWFRKSTIPYQPKQLKSF